MCKHPTEIVNEEVDAAVNREEKMWHWQHPRDELGSENKLYDWNNLTHLWRIPKDFQWAWENFQWMADNEYEHNDHWDSGESKQYFLQKMVMTTDNVFPTSALFSGVFPLPISWFLDVISRLRDEFNTSEKFCLVNVTHRYEFSVDGQIHGHENDEGKDCVEKKM